jgi:hypothetical protein
VMRLSCLKNFCGYFVKFSDAAPSAYPQCHWAIVKVYLGGG